MALIKFLASDPVGRGVRVIAGIVLVIAGLFIIGGTAGIIVAVIGLVPLLAGIFDVCVFAPLFGLSFYGKRIRGE
jgi:uncharacterized membrane protein HdeD (DUF308 family)